MKYKCCKCGGVSLTATCPIDINTDYIYEEAISTSVYCEDCDDFTNTIDIDEKEYNRIKKMPYEEFEKYRQENLKEYNKE